MAYVNVAEWKPEQVTEWLKGLDGAVKQYIHSFLNNEVSGQQLLNLRPDDLDHLGVHKLGHQEIILEAVEHLRNFHYELDRENLQLLALRLSCRAHSLHNELKDQTDPTVSLQSLADVANIITAVKPLVCWLDRSPFTGQLDYQERKMDLLKLSLAIATCAMRDRFTVKPVEEIRTSCAKLAELADSIIQDIVDPLILQPASLDLATLKKRAGDDLGFFILPSFHGVHQIGEIKFSSPAHQCGKIEEGDEVVQVNYQTVVGWQTKRVMALFEESPMDVFLTLKKRPRHTKVYGQIYMKPYRLPSKKRAAPYSRWHDNLPSPRPELLTIPDFEMPLPRATPKQVTPQPVMECEPLASNSSSDDDDDSFLPGVQDEGQTSPTSMRLYLPKPRVTVQRRATVTGASPTNKRPPVNIEQFWRELRLERQWKDSGPEGRKEELYQLRDKSASFGNDLSVAPPQRPTTCLGIENSCGRLKKQDKKLRIIESCEEAPSGSMESVKENKPTLTENKSEVYISQTTFQIGTEDNILRVKGGACISPTEVLSQIVDDVKKVDIQKTTVTSETTVFHHKERGRLDKSYSTPAYDNSDSDQKLDRNNKPEWTTSRISESSPLPSPSEDASYSVFQVEKQTQVVESCEESVNVVEAKETCITTKVVNLETSDASLEGDHSGEDEQTQRIGEILETINIALLQHRMNNGTLKKNSESSGKYADDQSEKFQSSDAEAMSENFPTVTQTSQVQEILQKLPVLLPESPTTRGPDHNKPAQTRGPEVWPKPTHINPEVRPKPEIWPKPQNGQPEVWPKPHVSQPEVWQKPQVSQPEVWQRPPVNQLETWQKAPSTQPEASQVKICVTPPEPPPRPAATLEHPKHYGSVGIRAIMAARSLGRNTGSKISLGGHATFPSPRSLRKRNPLLAKRRNVSVRDLDIGDCEGWLLHRCRSSGAGAMWLRAWFVLKGTVFYGFKTPQSTKADIMICLPGFTASLADEVKSRKYAFKVYHTGTVFYFAVESEEELSTWMDTVTQATLKQDFTKPGQDSDAVFFSETDEESETDMQTETCFPSPKMRKFAGFLSSSSASSQHEKQSSRSQQNLATEAKSQEAQKKFGSLRKLGRKTNDNNNSPANQEVPGTPASAASLDRKYLRFLGGSRNNIVPVPTAQFRSYRRVPNGPAPAIPQKPVSKQINDASEQRTDASQEQSVLDSSQPKVSKSSDNSLTFQSIDNVPASDQTPPVRMFKALPSRLRDPQIHSSNPSLQLSSDMADYRLAAERLREFGIRRNRQREDTSGFVTLEEFMLSRQEEERRQNRAAQRAIAAAANDAYTGYSEDPLSMTDGSNSSRNKARHAAPAPPVARRGSFNNNVRSQRHSSSNESSQDSRQGRYRGGSPEKIWINSLRRNDDTSTKRHQTPQSTTWATNRLKTAAQYQPPPVAQNMSNSRNNNSNDETPRMKLAFEMHLGENRNQADTHPPKPSKFRNLFSSSKSQQHQKQNLLESQQNSSSQQKTILGSPRLHRAIFRDKKHHSSKSSSTSDSSNSPVSPPTSATLCDWITDEYGSQGDPNSAQFKPTMGISMIGKKPSRRILNSSPSPASPPPDYPGLEYPPVFEPETYTLSDASSLLRSRQQANSKQQSRSTNRN